MNLKVEFVLLEPGVFYEIPCDACLENKVIQLHHGSPEVLETYQYIQNIEPFSFEVQSLEEFEMFVELSDHGLNLYFKVSLEISLQYLNKYEDINFYPLQEVHKDLLNFLWKSNSKEFLIKFVKCLGNTSIHLSFFNREIEEFIAIMAPSCYGAILDTCFHDNVYLLYEDDYNTVRDKYEAIDIGFYIHVADKFKDKCSNLVLSIPHNANGRFLENCP